MNARHLSLLVTLALALLAASEKAVGQEQGTDSALIRLLKSGKVPAERQVTLIDQLGKRGTPADLSYLLEKAIPSNGLKPTPRLKAMEALIESAQTRKVLPSNNQERLADLLKADASTPAEIRIAAIKLCGLWKLSNAKSTLESIAASAASSELDRVSAFQSLVALQDTAGIQQMTKSGHSFEVRSLAVASLVELGVDEATSQAVGLLGELKPGSTPTRLISAFLNRQDGGDKLAAAIANSKLSPDSAKLALRSVYELGRTDAALVAALTKAAGISTEIKPPTSSEIEKLIAEVQTQGNAARGEQVFRRADVNCMKCHALSGAGGGVGPELSPIGATSPVDYLIYSILVPDQSIKEEFQTKVFLTTDGRVLQGIVVDKDDKRVILKEATGDLRTIANDDIEESKDGGSLMPKGLTSFLTHAEFVDLLRFLSELGKPGPYAIRPVASIQRWRVLKSPAESLVQSSPDADVLASQVLGAENSRWFPAYALVNGNLQLDELVAPSGSVVLILQGEIEVSGEGTLAILLDSADGVSAWLDETVLKPDTKINASVSPGRHKLTIRLDTRKRASKTLKVDVARGEGTSAEFRVLGGR